MKERPTERTTQTRPDASGPLRGPLKSHASAPLKSLGEMEAAVCDGFRRFEQDYMGRGPKDIHAYLLGDLLVVRLTGALTVAEQQLSQSLPVEKGRDLIKLVRTHLIETARPILEAMILEATGVGALSLHHDISTITGEKIIIVTLTEPPYCRDGKRR
ncbi:MAG TPA: DUF2294 domain-containing protein [Planctomycetaceae bacterium]|nr:DUF2294 domain-containing protein [Planctomycetaceae bacterium]